MTTVNTQSSTFGKATDDMVSDSQSEVVRMDWDQQMEPVAIKDDEDSLEKLIEHRNDDISMAATNACSTDHYEERAKVWSFVGGVMVETETHLHAISRGKKFSKTK